MEEIINLTEEDRKTYNSNMVQRFTWCEDPKQNSDGLLFVQFTDSTDYVYYDIPRSVYESLAKLSDSLMPSLMERADATVDDELPTSVEEYLHDFVISRYGKDATKYNRIQKVLDERHE